jgi:hypothetical protein
MAQTQQHVEGSPRHAWGDEFCTRSPYLEGGEVFSLQKRKPDTSIAANDEIHQPDTLNFFRPRVAQRTTRFYASPLSIIVEESFPTMLEVPQSPPTNLNFRRVIDVEESKVDEKLWHIVAFLIILPRHIGPCILSPKKIYFPNCLQL